MKKFIYFAILVLSIMLVSCSCENKKTNGTVGNVTTTTTSITVERAIAMDREYMMLNYGGDYRWYETCILMKDFMDEETTSEVESVASIFQVVREKGHGFDTKVVMITHTPNADSIQVVDGFWVEDFPMNEEEIKLTYKEAFTKAMETNCVKPHSKHCVMRKEVGPNDANVQYIFGNRRGQVYVDAVTGEASNHNPVFLNGPLGEWP